MLTDKIAEDETVLEVTRLVWNNNFQYKNATEATRAIIQLYEANRAKQPKVAGPDDEILRRCKLLMEDMSWFKRVATN